MVNIIEYERRRLVDRRCTGAGGRVGLGAGMHGERRKTGSTVSHDAVPHNDGDRFVHRSGGAGKLASVGWSVPLMAVVDVPPLRGIRGRGRTARHRIALERQTLHAATKSMGLF